MNEVYHFEESISSVRTEAVFIALAALFLALAVWRLQADGLGWYSTVLLILCALFVFYSFNYRTLRILMTREALLLRFGVFSWTVPWRDIDDVYRDETSLARISGAGIHFTFIKGRYRVYLNFLEHPRVVLALKPSRGLVRDIAFTTRRPEEALAVIDRLVDLNSSRGSQLEDIR